jgi:hypothetical protein
MDTAVVGGRIFGVHIMISPKSQRCQVTALAGCLRIIDLACFCLSLLNWA